VRREAEQKARAAQFRQVSLLDEDNQAAVVRMHVSLASESDPEFALGDSVLEPPEPNPPTTREPKPLVSELQALRDASDMAARVFDTQLVIVQRAD
jgi:hypothetical protein